MTLLLLNLCRTHGCSNVFINDVFKILSCDILPVVNTFSNSEYMMSKKLWVLRLAYDIIHTCPNNYLFFRGDDNKIVSVVNGEQQVRVVETCRLCLAPRFKVVNEAKIPLKVLWHFPLIPRLPRMFRASPPGCHTG